jgi:hypothetical protein
MHAGRHPRRRDVNRLDPRMRQRAAHERRLERVPHRHIVDESARALEQRLVLDADDRLSDEPQSSHAWLAPASPMRIY